MGAVSDATERCAWGVVSNIGPHLDRDGEGHVVRSEQGRVPATKCDLKSGHSIGWLMSWNCCDTGHWPMNRCAGLSTVRPSDGTATAGPTNRSPFNMIFMNRCWNRSCNAGDCGDVPYVEPRHHAALHCQRMQQHHRQCQPVLRVLAVRCTSDQNTQRDVTVAPLLVASEHNSLVAAR